MSPLLDTSSDEDIPLAVKRNHLQGPPQPVESSPAPRPLKEEALSPKPTGVVPDHKVAVGNVVKKLKPTPKPPVAAKREPPPARSPASSPSKVVKPKKEYGLPGQTRDTPDESDPLRKFYTSLLDQRPSSEMARKWCLTYGLLSAEEAQAYVNELSARRAESRPASRAGSNGRASPAKKRAPSAKPKATQKKPPATATKRKATPASKPGSAGKKKSKTSAKVKTEEPASEEDWDEDSEEEILPTKKERSMPDWAATV